MEREDVWVGLERVECLGENAKAQFVVVDDKREIRAR